MSNNPKVTLAIGGHPVHPMLIPFPIAFFVGTLVTDVVFWGTGNPFWAPASFWLVAAGIVMALLAALAGFTDFFGEGRIRALNDAWYHMAGNLLAVVISIGSFFWRYTQGAEAAVLPWGIVMSAVVACILLFTGWMGWEMVYRHRVGIIERNERIRNVSTTDPPRRAA